MDDVLLCGDSTKREWKAFKSILELLCSMIGMKISTEKSLLLYNDISLLMLEQLRMIFSFSMDKIDCGSWLFTKAKQLQSSKSSLVDKEN